MRRYAGAAATMVCPLKSCPSRLSTGAAAAASPTIDSGRTHRGQQDHENDLSERRRLKFLSAQRRYVESSFRNNFLPFCGGDALRHEEVDKQAAAMGNVAIDNNSSSTSLSSSSPSSASSHRRPHPMIELSAVGNSRWSAAFRWRVSPTLSVVVQGTLRVENVVSTTKEEARYRMMAAVLLLLPNPAAVKRFLEVLEYRDVVAIDAAHRGVNVGWELVLHSEPFKAPLSHNDVERDEDDDIEAKEAMRVLAEPRAAKNRSGRAGGTCSTSSSSASSSEPNSASMSHAVAMMSRSITPSSLGYRVSIQSALPAFLEESLSNDKQHIIRGTLSSASSVDMTERVQTDENSESSTVLYTEMSTSTSPSMFVMVRDAAKHALARLAAESSVLMYLRLGAATQRELSTVTSMMGVSGDLFSVGSSVQPSSLLVQEFTAESTTPSDVQQQRRCDVAVPSTTAMHFASLSNHYLRTQLLSSFDSSATSSTNLPLLLPSMGFFFEEQEPSLDAPIIDSSAAASTKAVFNYSGYTNAAIRPLVPFTLSSSTTTKHHMAHSLSRFHSRHQFLKLEVPQVGVIDFVSRCKRETSQQRRRFHRHHPGDYHRATDEEGAEEVNKSDAGLGLLSDLGVLLPSVTELSSSSSVGSPTTYRWNDVHTLAAVTSAASVSSSNSALHRIAANRKNIGAGSGERAALASSQPTLGPIKADIVGEALLGCPLSTFALPHAHDVSSVGANAPLCLGRPYAALITSAVSTALLTEMLRTAGEMRVHFQRATTTNFSRSPQSADVSGGSVHAETTTTPSEDVGGADDVSASPSLFVHEDRTMDIPDVILMFQVIRETLLQSRDVVPTLTVTQNVNYSVTPHLVAIGLRGEGPQQIPVTTTCVLEWPVSTTTTSSTTTSSGSVHEKSSGGKSSSGPPPTGHHSSGSSPQATTMQYLRIERSSASTTAASTTSDSGSVSPTNLLRPGAGPLPLLIECVCALYRLIVTLSEHRFRDVSKSKSKYSSRELRQSRDAIVAAAIEFLERQSPTADGVPPGATTNSQEKRPEVLKRHAMLQNAIDPTTSFIATPTMIAHDVTKKQKFLDFLMFHWFGAVPQEKYFWIKKNELSEASGLSHTKQPQQTADGIGPVITKTSPALMNSSAAAGVDQTNRLSMYRGQLIYDVLGNRVLMAAVHAKTPLDAHRALLDSATLLNAPSSAGTTDQRWGNRSRKNRTFQRNNAKLPELLDNPTNSTTPASVPGTPVAFLPEPTQRYSLLVSNGPLLSPLTFYLQALAKLGCRAQLFSTAAATVAFVIFRSVGPKLSTAPEQKLDEALSIEKAFCAATTADRIKRLKEAGVVASCEIRPYNVNDSVVSSDQD
ncbi:Hypothetical protein, putative, partial [Bodo saltans]